MIDEETSEQIKELVEVISEQNEILNEQNETDLGEEIIETDALSQLVALTEKQNELLELQYWADTVLVGYGLLVVPLLLIIGACYWFMKQFLYSY